MGADGTTVLFDEFRVYKDSNGNFQIANRNEILMRNRDTGRYQKSNVNDFCDLITTIFPDKNEQKELLRLMFNK